MPDAGGAPEGTAASVAEAGAVRRQDSWSKAEERILVDLWFEGFPPRQIQARLPGRSLIAVKVRASRLHLPARDKQGGKLTLPSLPHKDEAGVAVALSPGKTAAGAGARRESTKTRSPQARMRDCLRCGDAFYSAGFGNRVCGNCHRSDEWQSGGGHFSAGGLVVD